MKYDNLYNIKINKEFYSNMAIILNNSIATLNGDDAVRFLENDKKENTKLTELLKNHVPIQVRK